VYNIEPFRAAVRQGDWKLVWGVTLPQSVELYNITQDPSERHNVAGQHPDLVAALEKRANELAAGAVKPMILEMGFQSMLKQVHLPPALPGEEFQFNEED